MTNIKMHPTLTYHSKNHPFTNYLPSAVELFIIRDITLPPDGTSQLPGEGETEKVNEMFQTVVSSIAKVREQEEKKTLSKREKEAQRQKENMWIFHHPLVFPQMKKTYLPKLFFNKSDELLNLGYTILGESHNP